MAIVDKKYTKLTFTDLCYVCPLTMYGMQLKRYVEQPKRGVLRDCGLNESLIISHRKTKECCEVCHVTTDLYGFFGGDLSSGKWKYESWNL